MKKISKNKKAVSAVIGVILMVAITVVIATTVYLWVVSITESNRVGPVELSMDVEEFTVNEQGQIHASVSITYNNLPMDEQNETFRYNDIDIFIVLYEANTNGTRVLSDWNELNFELYDLHFSWCCGTETILFDKHDRIVVGDGWYRCDIELWDRVNIPGESMLYQTESFYISPV